MSDCNTAYLFQVRLTGVLVEEERILIIRQSILPDRVWSLPGGRLQHGETLEAGMNREMEEETGLKTEVKKLLYICDRMEVSPSLLHVTLLVRRVGGTVRLPSNEFDENPISDVRLVALDDLPLYGFSCLFRDIAKQGFPGAGSYVGPKSIIGL